MRLLEFSASGWRNLAALSIAPQAGINVIFGDNAQGKTNLLEAIFYVASLRSFRTARPAQLIGWGQEFLRLGARAEAGGRVTQLNVSLSREGRRLRVDGTPVAAVDEYFGGFNVVLFTPEQLRLVQGEPGARRRFLDRALFNVDATQLGVVRHYNRVLRERNACLKQHADRPAAAASLLDVLDEQLSAAAATLVCRRQALRCELAPRVAAIHERVAGGDKAVELGYRCRGLSEATALWEQDPAPEPSHYASLLGRALGQRREEDLRRGFTGVGPHQDDLDLRLGGRTARTVASQGEARTIVLALKLAEVEFVHDRRSEPPVLLLDDMGSELDEKRREILFQTLDPMGCQTFLTTVAPELVPPERVSAYFCIDQGVLRQK
jgi:DNA replication and repair protein RecF